MLQKRVFVKIVFLFALLAYFFPAVRANAEDEKAFATA